MTDSEEKQRQLDATMENEAAPPSPMVQISLKEYHELKKQKNYITDPSLIAIIDKMEELTRALRRHIVRKF